MGSAAQREANVPALIDAGGAHPGAEALGLFLGGKGIGGRRDQVVGLGFDGDAVLVSGGDCGLGADNAGE